jgi:hypothetical protein
VHDTSIGVQFYGENDCSVELLARHHLGVGRYHMERWKRVRMVASAAALTSQHLILVVLQRQSDVFCYEYRFGMPDLAEVAYQRVRK